MFFRQLSFSLFTVFKYSFPYRISISVWIFIVVGMLTGLFALLMVGGQSWKAAHLNPVKTLRSE